MESNSIFNVTVCIMGIAIFLIHIVNLLTKRNKRKDENKLLIFLSFTAFHLAVYLTFALIKTIYTSDPFIMGFYTTFYVFNNIEAFLFFMYMLSYIEIIKKKKDILMWINISIFALFFVLDIVNIFAKFFFKSIGGEYERANTMFFAQGYQIIMLAIVLFVTLFNKKLVIGEKIAFACYCLLPLVAIVIQLAFPGYAIAYASIIIAIEILFFFVNVSKNIQLAEEQEKNKEAQIKIMMSQIQPHFIYNSLSTISTLITIDPESAQQALDDFSDYLRMNFSSLTLTKLVAFADELRHIRIYVELEKLRFNDRLKVIYDIQAMNFDVPPLSVQPIVENAIKHGIVKKVDGGVLKIKTYENDDAFVVEVIDNGLGFDMNEVDFKNNKHIGLNNVKQRINSMCHGDISFESEINKGTKVTITFYKD